MPLKIKNFLTGIMLAVLAFSMPASAMAASNAQLRDRIASLNAQIAKDQKTVAALDAHGDTLQNKLNSINAEINALQHKIDLATAEIADIKDQINQATADLNQQKQIMFENARTLYKMGNPTTIEILASSDSFSQFIDKQEYLTTVRQAVNEAADKIQALKDELVEKQQKLQEYVQQQVTQRELIEFKRDEQAELLAQTRGEEAKYQQLVSANKHAMEKAQAQLAAAISNGSYKVAPAGYVDAGEVVGSSGNTGFSTGPHLHLEVRVGSEPTNPGPYIDSEPISPAIITQSYGNPDPIYSRGYHPGTDYQASTGTAVHAIDSGNLYRGCSSQLLGTNAYGYVAIVEHTAGVIVIYAHLSGGPAACNYNTYY